MKPPALPGVISLEMDMRLLPSVIAILGVREEPALRHQHKTQLCYDSAAAAMMIQEAKIALRQRIHCPYCAHSRENALRHKADEICICPSHARWIFPNPVR